MIKNLIFDFGDVFINLDKNIVYKELEKCQSNPLLFSNIQNLNEQYEIGAIETSEFIQGLNQLCPTLPSDKIKRIWNAMLLDFPEERLLFIEQMALGKQYRLFLLSNTNALHIAHVTEKMGKAQFLRFKACFEQFYLSHEIGLRKPDAAVYQYVLNENKLNAQETLFIDDTLSNIDGAIKLGITCWHLKVGQESIIDLMQKL